jgi:hypothetical protein
VDNPVTLDTYKPEIGSNVVQGQLGQKQELARTPCLLTLRNKALGHMCYTLGDPQQHTHTHAHTHMHIQLKNLGPYILMKFINLIKYLNDN